MTQLEPGLSAPDRRRAMRRWLPFLPLLVLGVGWAADVLHRQGERPSDWVNFEIAARTFIHFQHNVVYAGNPFGLYARDPVIQIGPPAWLPLAGFQWLSPWHANFGFAMAMVLLGFFALVAIDVIARQVDPLASERRRLATVLIVGAAVMVDWSYNSGRWHHLDDVMALTFTMFASALIVRKRSWWLVGLLLGTAVAAKPWAVILSPVLMGLPRSERSRAALMTIVVAAVWWSPFILGASGTIHSLGSFPVPIRPGSEWWLFGMRGDIHTWLRPVQFIGGVVLGVLVARRTDRAWLAAPLAALAFRVLTDPFMWSYYGMGPVLFAFLWDMTRPGKWTRLPIYSVVTLLVEGLLPWLPLVAGFGTLNDWFVTVEWAKLAWGIAILVALLVETSPARRASSFVPAETAVSAPAAG